MLPKPEWVICHGEAHANEMGYDHCMVCLPYWGKYPVCRCGKKLKNSKCPSCKIKYDDGDSL